MLSSCVRRKNRFCGLVRISIWMVGDSRHGSELWAIDVTEPRAGLGWWWRSGAEWGRELLKGIKTGQLFRPDMVWQGAFEPDMILRTDLEVVVVGT